MERVMPGLNAAFVSITPKTKAYLPLGSDLREAPPSGSRFPVQIRREAHGNKCAYVTRDITFAGRYAVLLPFSDKKGISARITHEASRDRLKQLLTELCPDGYGMILRSDAEQAPRAIIQEEIEHLFSESNEMLLKMRTAAAPCILRKRASVIDILLRDELIEKVYSDQSLSLNVPTEVVADPFRLLNLDDKLRKSFQHTVYLPCGGNITVDICEALTVIDVNSGHYTGKKTGSESTFLKVNSEAASECARILRLRNIGGNIVIDFIDMTAGEDREQIIRILTDAFSHDAAKTEIHGFTTLGLL